MYTQKQIPRLGHIFTYKCNLRWEQQPRVLNYKRFVEFTFPYY